MNKRGFTLVELLAVITILALLALLTSTSVTKLVRDAKNDLSDMQVKSIESAAKSWAAENIAMLPSDGECKYLTLKDLKEYGLLDSSIVDSKASEEFSDDLKIKITSTTSTYGNSIIKYEVNPESASGCSPVYVDLASLNPGVYDEKYNLIATWDELVSMGIDMNKSTDYSYYINHGWYYNSTVVSYEDIPDSENFKILKNLNAKVLVIPDTVTALASKALLNNDTLTQIYIPDSVTSIGSYSFGGCNNLKSIRLSNSITSLEDNVFNSCYSLEKIAIPASVTTIKYAAFRSCTNLKEVNISSGLNSFDYSPISPFAGCNELSKFNVDSSNLTFESVDGHLVKKSNKELVWGVKSDSIPNGIASIGEYAFYGRDISKITIPASVKSIGANAFSGVPLVSAHFTVTTGWNFKRSSSSDPEPIDASILLSPSDAAAAISKDEQHATHYWIRN